MMVDKPMVQDEQVYRIPEEVLPENARPAPTIIVGLGNPILGDDGIGWVVARTTAEALSDRTDIPPADVECLSLGGLSLMEHLIGYDRAILIDAVNLEKAPNGTLSSFLLGSLPETAGNHLSSAHDTSLQTALKIGESMGARLPREIQVIGIQAKNVYDFSDQLTEPVAAALPGAVELVLKTLVRGETSISPKE